MVRSIRPSQLKCPCGICCSHEQWECRSWQTSVPGSRLSRFTDLQVNVVVVSIVSWGLTGCSLLAHKVVLWSLPPSGITGLYHYAWLYRSTNMKLATNFSNVFTRSPASFSICPRKFLISFLFIPMFFLLFVCLFAYFLLVPGWGQEYSLFMGPTHGHTKCNHLTLEWPVECWYVKFFLCGFLFCFVCLEIKPF